MIKLNAIKQEDKITMVKNLALMIKSGIAMNRSLELLSHQMKSPLLQKILAEGSKKVEKGFSLYDVFRTHESKFGSVFVNFIRAGEKSGTLEKNLNFLAYWMERENNLRKNLKSATLYPKIILVFGFVLLSYLTGFILPQITTVYAGLDNVELNVLTQALIWSSDFVRTYWIGIIVGLGAAFVLFKLLLKVLIFRKGWDYLALSVPIFGDLTKSYQLATSTQLLYSLFDVGFSINDALDIVTDAVTNIHYKEALRSIEERVIRGDSFSEALKEHPKLFPGVFVSITHTGESTGSFGESFRHLAEYYQEQVHDLTKNLPSVLEPVLLIFMGVAVGVVAFAIVTPLYQVTQGFNF